MALKRAVVLEGIGEPDLLGLGCLSLLGQQDGLDVGQHTTLGDGDTGEQFVQLLVIADGELQVSGDDPALLVVTSSIACQLENLGGQVLHHCSQVDGGASSHTLGVVTFTQVAVNTPYRELQTGTGAAGLALSLCLASFTTSRHDDSLRLRARCNTQSE